MEWKRSFYPRPHRGNNRIGPHTPTNHTVPYGTVRLGRVVPGTSCQATIMESLRDIFFGKSYTAARPRHRANHISDRILHLQHVDSLGMRSRSSCRLTIVPPGAVFPDNRSQLP